MTTHQLATIDDSLGAWAEPRSARASWLARVAAAIGRVLGRRQPGLRLLDPGEEPAIADRTRPIDAQELIDVKAPPPRAKGAAKSGRSKRASRKSGRHRPPPPPRTTGQRIALARAELKPGEFDALDALITTLMSVDELDLPPPPAIDDLAWLARLDPLIEYELMARGSTAVSFQSTAAQLAELVALGDTDFNAAVRVVSRDPAVAAAVLSAANSAEARRSHAVSDIRGAVTRLGLAETRRIGIATAARALHDADVQSLAPHHRTRAHCDLHRAMTCAFASAALAARTGAVGGDDAFVAGMFLDLGRPLVHRAVVALERRQRVDAVPTEALDLILDRTHAAAGADALLAWGLPRRLADLARHHFSASVPSELDGPDLQRATVVSSLVLLRVGARVPLTATRRAVAALGLDRDGLRTLALEVADMAARVTELFGVRDADTSWTPPLD